MSTRRADHTATVLPDGRVLAAGGTDGTAPALATTFGSVLAACYRGPIDLRTATTRRGPRLSEKEYKLDGALVALPGGRVVIAGGTRIDVFQPGRTQMRVLDAPTVPRRSFLTATAVGPNAVLVVGGYDDTDARIIRIPNLHGD